MTNSLEDLVISHVGEEKFAPGMDRIRPYFKKFKNPFSKAKIVTIAGTNGKGETSHRLNYLLNKKLNLKTAMWTSPHIVSVTERFCFGLEKISENSLKEIVTTKLAEIEKGSLSYYEFLFLCFCELTLKNLPDVIIFEVGLGGRFDAVNLFDPNISAITSISLDHTEILGNTEEKILYEKLGISREGVPLITALSDKELRKFINHDEHVDLFENRIVSLSDDYSKRNKLLSIEIFKHLTNVKDLQLDVFDKMPAIKGRFEKIIFENVEYLFVGSHNIDGVSKLIENLKSNQFHFDETWIGLSTRKKSDLKQIFLQFIEANQLYEMLRFFTFDHPRAVSNKDILEVLEDISSESFGLVEKLGEEKIEKSHDKKRILVTGSYYFIGAVQKNIYSR